MFTPEHVAGAFGCIAHALGGIDGASYTNSREAFLESRRRGFRLMEVDLFATADDQIVCFHECKTASLGLRRPPLETTRNEFLAARYDGKHAPLDARQLFEVWSESDDLFLITDTKNDNRRILPRLIDLARRFPPTLLNRLIPQVYSRDDLDNIQRLGVFETIIFTRYLCDYNDDQIVELAQTSRVAMIAMVPEHYSENLKQRLHAEGCGVYLHTINDEQRATALRREGVGVYTDFLSP